MGTYTAGLRGIAELLVLYCTVSMALVLPLAGATPLKLTHCLFLCLCLFPLLFLFLLSVTAFDQRRDSTGIIPNS